MKRLLLAITGACLCFALFAQNYPDPEFTNEVYFLRKDSGLTLVRLEKNLSRTEMKAGFGGSEYGYTMDGQKSPVRIKSGAALSFVFFNGNTGSSGSDSRSDSVMRANGMDPAMIHGMNAYSEPGNAISLYKVNTTEGKRKVYLQKNGPALPFVSHKAYSSEKFTFSVKKIREGYWVLVIDKPLQPGEYAFTMMNMMGGSNPMDNMLLYAFGVE